MRTFLLITGVIVLLILARMSVFTVDRSEYVYVTTFGQHTATYDGATDAGLHFRWPAPVQSVEHIDRRLQYFDLPATEQLTRDAGGQTIDRTLLVEGFVCWQIADAQGVDRFIKTVGTPDRAQAILTQQINSQLSAEIGKMGMDQFANVAAGEVDRGMAGLRRRLLDRFRDGQGEGGYGVNIVDVRLRRYNYPAEVRPDIIDRIRSERMKKKADYESEAAVRVGKIEADSRREVQQIAAEAEAQATRIRGAAEAAADRIRGEAFSKDPDFYVFLTKLEQYQKILGNNKTVLLLSSHRELFDRLFNPPRLTNGNNGNGKGTVTLKPHTPAGEGDR